MSAYRCPSCGTSDPLGYVRCNQSSCPDGRDPRPQSDAEVDHLRAQVSSLQKELAERTAERDRHLRDAGKLFATSCKAANRALILTRRVEALMTICAQLTKERDRERKHVARLMRDLQHNRERAEKAEAIIRAGEKS